MDKVNILILTCSLHVGGAEKHLYDLVSNINKEKYKIIIVCLYELGAMGELISNGNQDMKIHHNLLRNKFDIFGILKLFSIIRNENIHVLFAVNTPLTLFWGIVSAKLAGIKVTITRSPTTNPTRHVKRWKIVNYLVLNFVSRIIAQAYSQREYLINHVSADPEKITVIYNGVDVERFSSSVDMPAFKQKLGIPSNAPIVGIVGRLAPQKGHDLFLKAARIILDSFPDAHFLILGDGMDRINLEEMSKALSIQENVHFLGMVRDVSAIIPLFSVAVLASNPVGETFSNAILEYMASSKPVVATNVGSIAEQVIDGKTGFLVPYGNASVLADAVSVLLNNSELATELGKAGKELVKEKFTTQEMVARYEHLFADLLKPAEVQGE